MRRTDDILKVRNRLIKKTKDTSSLNKSEEVFYPAMDFLKMMMMIKDIQHLNNEHKDML